MSESCAHCKAGPVGEKGHADLEPYVGGPFPGQHIFKCRSCDERWIRHHGGNEPYGWTRYSDKYQMRKPATHRKGEA